ncbi:hypothetical protein ACHAXR_009821 [Thalassiosira sp. AJA248-18]
MGVNLNALNSLLRHKKFEPVPPSHWRSLGRDEHNITAYNNLQLKLINYIRRPSRTIDLQPVDDDGNSLFDMHLQYDVLLSKLWKYLAIALIHREDCSIDSFRVIDVQLVPSVMAQLAKALKAKKLKTLGLNNNNFSSEGIIFVAGIIKENATLKRVSLNTNFVDDLGSAIQLADALSKHPYLESLSLRYCSFGEDLATLSAIIPACNNVKFLDLRNTDIGSGGAAIVSSFLATNPCMETLNLSNNSFNDWDADIVAQGILTNTNLKLLYMSNNPLSEVGKKALLRGIFDTTSLNSTIESNHTCELIFSEMHTSHELVMLINNFTAADTNRKRKIVFAIYDAVVVQSDFHSLERVPAQLAPDILGLIQFGPLKYMSSSLMFNYSLTLTYKVLRGWLCSYLRV